MADEPQLWKEEMRAYQVKNPGHCGLCGLPFEHCYHRKPEYREEVAPLLNNQKYATVAGVQSHWYLTSLNQMGPEEARDLPKPPKKRFFVLLSRWLEAHPLPPIRKTRFQVMLEES